METPGFCDLEAIVCFAGLQAKAVPHLHSGCAENHRSASAMQDSKTAFCACTAKKMRAYWANLLTWKKHLEGTLFFWEL